MTISQVALSNTFNEFRTTVNDISNTLNSFTDIAAGVDEYSTESIFANGLYANTISTPSATLTSSNTTNTRVSSLTSGRVVLAGTAGLLQDDSGLTFNTTTNTLTSGNLAVSGTSNFVGDATVATDKIVLHSANGGATFANTVTSDETHSRRLHAVSVGLDSSEGRSWANTRGEDYLQHLVLGIGESDAAHDMAIVNTSAGANAYAEFIAYTATGNSDAGWISTGVNSSNYTESAFSITGADDAYVLYEADPTTTNPANLVIATGGNGTENKIIIAAGGFSDPANNTQMIITPGQSVAITIATQSANTTTGALVVNGGIGLLGNLNVGGNVAITGTITLGGGGNTVSTSSLAVDNPIIFVGSNNAADTFDLGFVGEYTSTGTKYNGLVRDASDSGKWKLFSGISTEPANTVDFTSATFDILHLGALHAVSTTASTSNTSGALIVSGGAGIAGNIFGGGTVNDSLGNVREVPAKSTTGTYTLIASDSGKHVAADGNVTVAQNVFTVGQAITVYNNSGSSISVLQGSGVTLRQAGTASTGTRTLAQRGLCTLLCVATNDFVINGGGLT